MQTAASQRWSTQEESVKVSAFAVLTALIAFPAEAGQRQRQSNVSPLCDNNGRCTTRSVTASSTIPSSRAHRIRTSEREAHRAVDANGNSMMVTVKTAFGFNITVHPAYAGKFQKFFALLKERGYKVPANITKCWAPRGTHVAGSNHYIGAACDIQKGWNRGTRLRLPHERHRRAGRLVQRLFLPRLRPCRSGPWHAQQSA
jgi:hypothetical protein